MQVSGPSPRDSGSEGNQTNISGNSYAVVFRIHMQKHQQSV